MGLPEHGLTCEAFEVGESLYVVVDDLPSRQATDALVAVAHWAQLEAGLRSADGCMLSFPSFEGDEEVLRELQVPNGSYFAERVCLDLPSVPADGDTTQGGAPAVHDMGPCDGPRGPEGALFLIPHQDDELYTFAVNILHASEEMPVAVMLLTDGAGCDVRSQLSDGGSCAELGDTHEWALDRQAFSHARDLEFIDSCMALGIPLDNVHLLEDRMADLSVDCDRVEDIVCSVLRAHPFVRIYAHAPRYEVIQDEAVRGNLWAPPHRDHCMAGRAVERVRREGLARDVRYCVEFYDLDRFVDANPGVLIQQHVLPEAYVRPFKEALLAYKLWDPSRQRFAIGWHSGPWMHDEALERSTTYDYDPNAPDAESCDDCDRLRAHLEVIGSMRDQAAVRLGEATGQALAAQALCDQREHELEELRTYVQALEGSVSFRVGRVLTAPMRFVRDRLAKPGR